MMLLKKSQNKYIEILAFLLTGLFIVLGSLVSLHRYWQSEAFYVDFGIIDQAIWEVSRFQPPIVFHFVLGEKWIFADHFSPSLFLLSPLYWFTEKREIMLIAQSIIVGFSGLVLYSVGKNILKNQLLSFTILCCYFLFTGLQMAVISEFHDLTLMTLPLSLVFWSFFSRKKYLYFIFLFIVLGFKEITFLLGIGIGLFILLMQRDWIKIGITTIIVSTIWGIVSIKFIIPFFSGGIFIYSPELHPTLTGNILAFFDHELKRRTLFYSFLSFGFLPLLSYESWFLLLQDYAVRFLPIHCCSRWDLGLHYNAQSAVLLAVSAIIALKRLQPIKKIRYIFPLFSVLLVTNAVILYRVVLHGPFALAYNFAFYNQTKNFFYINDLINKIPKGASVMTQNNLALRFSHQKVWLLRKNYRDYKPDYVVIDLRGGQNPNNFFGSDDPYEVKQDLMKDKQYTILYQAREQIIFKRKI